MKLIEKDKLQQIIIEELKEVLGMDVEYERSQLAAKVRDMLDEYTGEDLEAAMDALNAVRAMLSAEMEEYDDPTGRDKVYDDEERRARRAGPSKPMSPEEHEAYLALYDDDEDINYQGGGVKEAVRRPRGGGVSKNRALRMASGCAIGYLQGAGYKVDQVALQRALTGAILEPAMAAENQEDIEEDCGCPDMNHDEPHEPKKYFKLKQLHLKS